jgi:phytoene/squalene synthetase
MLRAEGIAGMDFGDGRALRRVLRRLSDTAEQFYADAEASLDAFSPDCRVAIQSCIEVYRQLNRRIGSSSEAVLRRESVPLKEKFRVLPPSKYWRLPLAYLGAI